MGLQGLLERLEAGLELVLRRGLAPERLAGVDEPVDEELVVAGAAPRQEATVTLEDGVAQVLALKEQGLRLKDAAKEVAEHTGLSKNDLYAAALEKQ